MWTEPRQTAQRALSYTILPPRSLAVRTLPGGHLVATKAMEYLPLVHVNSRITSNRSAQSRSGRRTERGERVRGRST
eukprot:7057404-Prorocentrum_lima.AAC.1